MAGILNNFAMGLNNPSFGTFNPSVPSLYENVGNNGLQAVEDYKAMLARQKVDDMLYQAQQEKRVLNPTETAYANQYSPDAMQGYAKGYDIENSLSQNKRNEIDDNLAIQQKKDELTKNFVMEFGKKMLSVPSNDVEGKKRLYAQLAQRGLSTGIMDDDYPMEWSPEAESQIVNYYKRSLTEISSGNAGGATGEIIDRLMASNPNLTYEQALFMVQAGNRQGRELDENGNIVPTGGSIETIRATKEAEALGKGEGEIPSFERKQQIESLPTATQKLIYESKQGIEQTQNAVNRGYDLYDRINTGVLDLGLVKNMTSDLANSLGNSTPESRSYNDLKSYLEELVNNKLLIAKGVQTEGDAKRARDTILNNLNDTELVKERLGYLVSLNENFVNEENKRLDSLYRQNNKQPDAFNVMPAPMQSQQSNQDNDPLGLFK